MTDKTYHKEYNLKRYHDRMNKMKDSLGGRCVVCGSIDNLEFDHINPEDRSFRIGEGWDKSWSDIEIELRKCQLLCKKCHHNKTLKETGKNSAIGTHGTISSYRHCHCELCKEAKRLYTVEYRKRVPRKDGHKKTVA